MRVLVTGSHGFIGRNLVKALQGQEEWHELFLYDTKVDKSFLNQELPKVDRIYHLACVNQVAAVKSSFGNVVTNAYGAKLLADHAKKTGAHLVYTSTASVYGNAWQIPTPSYAHTLPESDYAVAKLAGEQFIRNSGCNYTIFRLSNVYGPGQTIENPYCGVVGRFLDQKRRGEPLTVIGGGVQTRDFTFVGDVVEYLLFPTSVGVWNVSHGKETSVYDLASMISDTFCHIRPRKVDTIDRRCLDPDLYCPTTLEEGLELTS